MELLLDDHTEESDCDSLDIRISTLAAVVDSSDDAIISKTLDGIITTWNSSAQRIFGYTPEEAIGQPILMLIPASRRNEEAEILDTLKKGRRVKHLETVRLTKTGREIHVSVTSSPVKDSRGRIVGASKIVRDITERKWAEAESRQQKSALEHLARQNTMGEMATGLAHELNQPLTSTLTYAGVALELIRSEKPPLEKITVAMQEVVSETRRAADIIRLLRDFSRKRDPRPETLDVNQMVMDSIHLVEHDFRLAEMGLTLRFGPDLPAVSADSIQLVQVMVNLLRNARDAMLDANASGKELSVLTYTRAGDVQVDVVDCGCGVTDEQFGRLFDRFFSTKSAGLGLGLAISKTIIESLGGRLTAAKNNSGNGMTFSIMLPACQQGVA